MGGRWQRGGNWDNCNRITIKYIKLRKQKFATRIILGGKANNKRNGNPRTTTTKKNFVIAFKSIL